MKCDLNRLGGEAVQQFSENGEVKVRESSPNISSLNYFNESVSVTARLCISQAFKRFSLFLTFARYGISPENIILYGQSIGTVPTVDLASRYECAAVVLHSPLTSGMRVAFPDTKKTYCFDAFPKWVSVPLPLCCPSLPTGRLQPSQWALWCADERSNVKSTLHWLTKSVCSYLMFSLGLHNML